jgi:hypothetical protein
MRRHIVAITVGFVAVALVGASVAGAAPREKAGCPGGFDLMTVERINATITTVGFEQVVIDFDAAGNNDGLLCVHLLPPTAGNKDLPFDPLFKVSDNVGANPNSVVVLEAQPRPVGH